MLSVIVPIYNAREFLSRCLESLLLQGMKDYEIVCVDDGSTDGSAEVLRRYEKSYPTVIKVLEQENQGSSVARNEGMRIAKGDVIAFCDADDFLIPGAYRYLLENFWTEDIDLLRFDSLTLDKNMMKKRVERDDVSGRVVFEGDARVFFVENNVRICFVWQNLYRKSFLAEHGIEFRKLKQCEDTAFNLDVYMCAPKMKYVDSNVYRYTTSAGQITRRREPFYLRDVVESYLTLFETMRNYALQYPNMEYALNRYVEKEMMPCFSRVLSANYSESEWSALKSVLLGMRVLPLHLLGTRSKVVNAMMANYFIYSVASWMYRKVFVPYVLPHLSRN